MENRMQRTMKKVEHEFGSITWAKAFGQGSHAMIKRIAEAKDYNAVRSLFDFHSDGRTSRGATIRAIKNAPKLVSFEPYHVTDDMIYSLCWLRSLDEGAAVYLPMRKLGKQNEDVSD